MWPAPWFPLPKDFRPRRPDPLAANESRGLEVEWMSVSSRSRTRVLGGSWKGAFRLLGTGVGVLDASEDNWTSDIVDGGKSGGSGSCLGLTMDGWSSIGRCMRKK